MDTLEYPKNFGMLPSAQSCFEDSKYIVVPVPLEKTTSYGKGTARGPCAIISASHNLELFDEQMKIHPCIDGICTSKPIECQSEIQGVLADIQKTARSIAKLKKIPCFLGGEHTLSVGAIKGLNEIYKKITVLHLDAHADLKDEYESNRYSHACTLRRIREHCRTVSVFVRSLDEEENKLIKSKEIPVFFAHEIFSDKRNEWLQRSISMLSQNVYITVDLDCFDSSLMPATGTPEPGGPFWYDVLDYLKCVSETRNIVGFDIVELAPKENHISCDYLAAKLAYKIMAYISSKKEPIGQVDNEKK